ncbi:RevS [Streptococcus pseudoporcinus]|uniref:RevS n=1 Tax=Streptococcus pseudoporcinus TaxID=361101 RepID=A0A4U9XUX0_9STRE|nr:RevS [Streptococcus pseudoporcinus]
MIQNNIIEKSIVLNIFILEDDFNQQDRLQETIKNIASQTEIKYKKLNVFGKPNQLISEINETGNHQIFFLDIEIKNEKKERLGNC